MLSFLLLCLITSCGLLQGSSCTFNMWRSQTPGSIHAGLRTVWASRRRVPIWQSAVSIETLVPNTLPRGMGHLRDSWSLHTTWMHHGAAPSKCHVRLRATLNQASYGPKMALLCHSLRNTGEILFISWPFGMWHSLHEEGDSALLQNLPDYRVLHSRRLQC
jgi:hypothetical protein